MSLEIFSPHIKDSSIAPIRQKKLLAISLKFLKNSRRLLTARNLVVTATVTIFGATLLVFINYFSHLVFTKPKQAVEGSFTFNYFVSEFVKEMPAFKPLENSVTYHFNIISGASIPAYIVRYESNAPPDEIVSYYRLYFQILNYTYIKHSFESDALAMFRNTREEFAVFVTAGEDANTVSIENFKYD